MFPFILAPKDWQEAKLMFGKASLAALCKVREDQESVRDERRTNVWQQSRM